MDESPAIEIEQLFEKARQNGGYEYLYTLVRIDGLQLQANYIDDLVVLRNWLVNGNSQDAVDSYRYLLSLEDPLKLLQNLVNNSNSDHYNVSPFMRLAKGGYPNLVWPTQLEKVTALANDLLEAGFPVLADRLVKGYSANLLENAESKMDGIALAVHSLSELFRDLLNHYFNIRKAFGRTAKYRRRNRTGFDEHRSPSKPHVFSIWCVI
jgi:hypothetical protein